MSANSSILSAVEKLRFMLTREDKLRCLGIAGFALTTSALEILTAFVIVIFAQTLTQPEIAQKYLVRVGFFSALSPSRILFYTSLIVGGIYLIKNLVAAAEVFYQNFSIQKMAYHFKGLLMRRYAQMDYGSYLTRNSSFGVQVIGGDAEQMFSGGMLALAIILSESMVFLCLIGAIVYMNPSLAFTIFSVGALLGFFVVKILFPLFYRWGQKMQEASIHTSQNLLQFFHAFKEIVLLGKKESFVGEYQHHSLKKSRIQAMQTAFNALPRIVIETLFMGLFVTAIALMCLEHESPVGMMGILGGYLYAGFRLMPGLTRIINQLNVLKYVSPSIERVYKEYVALVAEETCVDVPNLRFDKSIILNDVSFQYLNTKKDALKNVSLEIKKGECIGIVGETGSGKSTLVDILLGLLRPYKGSVLIDNQFPANSYQWHQRIGYVPQSVYLVDDTIEANIALGESSVDKARLQNALEAAQLKKFIDQLPEGIKTVVGERGIRLSGGERQRIAIARALYRNPEVLIFDEATSALDNETEAKLMETIHRVSKNRTVIMIAHRLTTLKGCDRVVAVESGRIKECATHMDIS